MPARGTSARSENNCRSRQFARTLRRNGRLAVETLVSTNTAVNFAISLHIPLNLYIGKEIFLAISLVIFFSGFSLLI